MSERYDCIIVGGGVIGLGIAWRASQLGLSVAVCEAGDRPEGASWAAAGMLAPVTEAAFGEEKLLKLNLMSAHAYPSFLEELSESTGLDLKPCASSTLYVALDRDQREALVRLFDFQRSLKLKAEWLDAEACLVLEPSLHSRTRAGILAQNDAAVDPRMLLKALAKAAINSGADLHNGTRVNTVRGGPKPEVTLEGNAQLEASSIVLCAGSWSGQIEGAPRELRRAIRPVKGQILRLTAGPSQPRLLEHVVRTEEVYLVPRPGGEIVVGATVEEKGYDTAVTAGAVLELLTAADRVVPGIRELNFKEFSAGLRPGTPDNAPILGKTSEEGIIAATGHFRNGVLLAPFTAAAIAGLLAKGEAPDEIAGFEPERFL